MPPSSLDMERRGTAARTGRAEMAESRHEHRGHDVRHHRRATSTPTSRTRTSPATKRRAATTPRPIRTSSTTSAEGARASSTRTTKS